MEKVSLSSCRSWSVPNEFKLPPSVDCKYVDFRWRAFEYNVAYANPIKKNGVYDFAMDGFLHRVWIDKEGWIHRKNGPAMEMINGRKTWWFHGFVIRNPSGGDSTW